MYCHTLSFPFLRLIFSINAWDSYYIMNHHFSFTTFFNQCSYANASHEILLLCDYLSTLYYNNHKKLTMFLVKILTHENGKRLDTLHIIHRKFILPFTRLN